MYFVQNIGKGKASRYRRRRYIYITINKPILTGVSRSERAREAETRRTHTRDFKGIGFAQSCIHTRKALQSSVRASISSFAHVDKHRAAFVQEGRRRRRGGGKRKQKGKKKWLVCFSMATSERRSMIDTCPSISPPHAPSFLAVAISHLFFFHRFVIVDV